MSIPVYQHVVDQCRKENPRAWEHAHTKGDPESKDFIFKLVPMLRAIDPNFGWNGKRGNPNDISEDAVNYICDAEDSEGRTPDGRPCVVIDVIAAAGAKPPYTSSNPAPSTSWTVFRTKVEGSGANIIALPAIPGTPNPPQPTGPTLLPYEALGGDATGMAISRAMAFDYERRHGKLDKGCGAWMFRSCYVLMARQDGIDTADKAIAKYRPEWCRGLGLTDMPPIPADF